ncbi:MAG: diacylglycerol kinase family lipid kinase [Bacteroidales bacterium]|nr:diacylglycerol kinase family lipid kinase [Bacteroidales bacterium]
MRRSITIIINPIAGVRPKDEIPDIVNTIFPLNDFETELTFTEYPGHASEIAKDAVRRGVDSVVAIGGDGTINETAKSLIGSTTALGIVPMGSGNGLARHIQIPLELSRALEVVKKGHRETIDYGDVNGHIFFCTAGVGFDAMVSNDFAKRSGRGPINYAKSVIDIFSHYNPMTYSIYTDDKKVNEKAFLIAIGNAAQYGNNAFITPRASMNDGMLDVTLIKPFPLVEAPQITMQLFAKTLDKNPNVMSFRSESIRIVMPTKKSVVHIDGEPYEMEGILNVGVHHNGLNVLTPAEPMNNVLEPFVYAIEDIHYSIWNNVQNKLKQVSQTLDGAVQKAVVEPIEQLKKQVRVTKKDKK